MERVLKKYYEIIALYLEKRGISLNLSSRDKLKFGVKNLGSKLNNDTNSNTF